MAINAPLGTGNVTTAVATTATNTITVPIPGNAVVGDVLLVALTSDYAGPFSTVTPGWARISAPRSGTVREASVFRAFTTNGVPAAPVFTQGANGRSAATMFRVTGASQDAALLGTSAWATTADSTNTTGLTIPSTGATLPGLTIAVAYNNSNAAQTAAAGSATIDGTAPDSSLVSWGANAVGSANSTTPHIVRVSKTPGPFVVAWGKTVANSQGVAVTIASADATTPPPVVEPEHEDEAGVMVQVGPGNVTMAAEAGAGVKTIDVPVPTRTKTGDVLVCAVTHSGNQALTFPAGWTLLSKVRTGSNRWLAAYAMPINTFIPITASFTCNGETDLRMSAIMVRVTGVGADDYLQMVGDWQLTPAEDNKTAYTIPQTTGVTAGRTLILAYTNTSAGSAAALTTVANGVLVGHSYKAVPGAATTTLSAWRHHSGVRKDVTISPAAANAAGFQLTFQAPQPKSPSSWEAKIMQGGQLKNATVAAVKVGGQFMKPSLVSWQPKDYVLDDLFSTNPFYIAHRGSGDNWPEHTMESYTNAAAYGVKALEVSVNITKDGVLICHHDQNFVKTAGDSRKIVDMTYAEILAEIKIDTRQWTGTNTPLVPPPLAKDVIDAYIDTHVIFIEDKGGTAATQLLNLMDTYSRGKEKFVWKQWAGAGQWQAAAQRGYKTWGYFLADIFARIPELAPNFDYLGIPHTASDTVISEIVALGDQMGKPVICWEIHYRWMHDRVKALGVKGMMTSNIPYIYTSEGTPQFTRDQFKTGLRTAGDMPHSSDAGWAIQPIIDPVLGVCRFIQNGSAAYSMGSMCPIPWDRYAIEFEMRWPDRLPAATTHAGIYFGHAQDTTHRTGVASDGGYHLIQRVNGVFDLYRHDPGSTGGIPLGTGSTTLPKVGEWMKFRLEVTPETITAKRIENGQVTMTLGSGDALYRGRYFGLQKNFTVTATDPVTPLEYRNVTMAAL